MRPVTVRSSTGKRYNFGDFDAYALDVPDVPTRDETYVLHVGEFNAAQRAYREGALIGIVKKVENAIMFVRNKTLATQAWCAGRLVGGGVFTYDEMSSALMAAAIVNGVGVEEPRASAATIKHNLEKGMLQPRGFPAPNPDWKPDYLHSPRKMLLDIATSADPVLTADVYLANTPEMVVRAVDAQVALHDEWLAVLDHLAADAGADGARSYFTAEVNRVVDKYRKGE